MDATSAHLPSGALCLSDFGEPILVLEHRDLLLEWHELDETTEQPPILDNHRHVGNLGGCHQNGDRTR